MQNSDNQLADEEVVRLVQGGKVEPFGILVKRYEEKIKRYARKFLFGYEEIEDLVQNVFLKAYVNLQSFDASRRFSPWIYRLAHNEFINFIKKKKREPLSLFELDVFLPHFVSKDSADGKAEAEEIKKFLDSSLQKLKPKYREPLVLYYFEELSYQEIADILRVPISTVGIRLKRAKEQMKSFGEKLGY